MDWTAAAEGLKREIASGNVTLHQVLAELEPSLPQRLALLEQVKEAFGIAQDELLLDMVQQARTHMLMSQFFWLNEQFCPSYTTAQAALTH